MALRPTSFVLFRTDGSDLGAVGLAVGISSHWRTKFVCPSRTVYMSRRAHGAYKHADGHVQFLWTS